MKIALDPAMFNAAPLEASFRAAAEAGYRYIELSNRDDVIGAFGPVSASPSDLSRARRWANAAGVEIASVAVIQHGPAPMTRCAGKPSGGGATGSPPPRSSAAGGSTPNCRAIRTGCSAECHVALLRSLDALLPIIQREGIEVVAEPHPWDFVETTREAVDLVRAIGSDVFRYLHCLPHTYYLGGSAADQLAYARGWFDHVHVADTYRPSRTIVNPRGLDTRTHQHFDIGAGELDWSEIVRDLRTGDFDGLLTVQVFGWEEQAERSFLANRSALFPLFADLPQVILP